MGLKSKQHGSNSEDMSESTQGRQGSRDADFSNIGDNGEIKTTSNGQPASNNADDGAGDKIAKLKQELVETQDKYLRALADLENFRKRAQKERSELLRYQGDQILVDILEVLDGLERALEHSTSDSSKLIEGIKLIHKQFTDVLGKWEVRPDSAMGKAFDPNRQRAIGKMAGEKSGIVMGELKKAYFYRDKLLRVGEVVVSEAPQTDSQ